MKYTKQEFIALVQKELTQNKVNEEDFKDINLCIHRIRLNNTIGMFAELRDNDDCLQYRTLFSEKYLDRMVNEMEFELTTGMGFYSKKYNISIGGIPNHESFYVIKDIKKKRN